MTRAGYRASPAALSMAALLAAACAPSLRTLPSGPAAPAADAAAVIAQATTGCRAVNTITLEMSVHGKAAGRRLRGRLIAGLAKPASARLEAVAPFGDPLFVFVATGDDASLLLPRDRRVLEHGRAADVLDAISGVPLGATALRLLVTGCAEPLREEATLAYGNDWRVTADGPSTLYFRRDSGAAPWRLVTTIRPGAWRAEYSMFENGLPRAVRLVSQPPGTFDLRLDLSQVDVNVALPADAFRLPRSSAAQPMSLDELRASGPLGAK